MKLKIKSGFDNSVKFQEFFLFEISVNCVANTASKDFFDFIFSSKVFFKKSKGDYI